MIVQIWLAITEPSRKLSRKIAVLLKTRRFSSVSILRWKERKCHGDAHVPSTWRQTMLSSAFCRKLDRYVVNCVDALPCGDVISSIAMPMPWRYRYCGTECNDIATRCGEGGPIRLVINLSQKTSVSWHEELYVSC